MKILVLGAGGVGGYFGAKLMRAIVCETAAIGPFNLMLTPHYDWGHKDHFHFEVRSDIRWFLIQ